MIRTFNQLQDLNAPHSDENNPLQRRQFLSALSSLAAAGVTGGVTGVLTNSLMVPNAYAQPTKKFRIYAITWRGKTQVEQGLMDFLGSRGVAVEFIWRDAAQNPAKLEEFVREIKAMQKMGEPSRLDLIYTWGTPPTLGITGAYDAADTPSSSPPSSPASLLGTRFVRDIPVLFAAVAAPVAAKVVPSLTNQGRDITGVYHVAAIDAQIQAMRTYRKFTKLGVLYNAAEANSVATAESLRKLGSSSKSEKFELIEATFDRGTDNKAIAAGIEEKILALKQAGAEWLYLGPDSFLFSQIERIAAAALEHRLPTFSATEGALNAHAPVLAGLVSSYYAIGQFAALKAEQILVKGKKARDIPIETLSRYSFIVRMKVAKQLDFLPPVSLFNYATIR